MKYNRISHKNCLKKEKVQKEGYQIRDQIKTEIDDRISQWMTIRKRTAGDKSVQRQGEFKAERRKV